LGEVEKLRDIPTINKKIKEGDIVVLTAEEFIELVENEGKVGKVAREVDVITTGTFGIMCSSGAVVNLGHSDPPIKIERAWINDVPVCHSGAAVDLYIGASKMSEIRPFEYGGGHVIEELVRGNEVELRATAYGTDCYPRTQLLTRLTKYDLNQFILLNFRNTYQKYVCAVNSSDETIYTYMGKLYPRIGNATFSGAGALNPLTRDPTYRSIGIGTRIFLGGGVGYVIGEGTQHNPKAGFGTLMVKGDAKKMKPEYIRGAAITGYGTSMFVGLGIPIPIIDMELARSAAKRDEDLITDIVDYGVPRRERPVLGKVSYAELKSGRIVVGEKTVKVSPLSSLPMARKIAMELKKWIEEGEFYLTEPVERLSTDTEYKPMKMVERVVYVGNIVRRAVKCREDESLEEVAERMIKNAVNHIVIVDDEDYLKGIVTSWDVTKAVAEKRRRLKEVIVRNVVTAYPTDTVEEAARRMKKYDISALPVVNMEKKVLGIVTAEDIAKLWGARMR